MIVNEICMSIEARGNFPGVVIIDLCEGCDTTRVPKPEQMVFLRGRIRTFDLKV